MSLSRLALIAIGCLAMFPRGAAAQPQADLYVVSIGVEPQLTARGKRDIYAQDAQFIATALAAANPLFRKVAPTVVGGQDATPRNVLAALEKLKTRMRPQDLAVVFFSTHGNIEPDGDYAITLANGPKGKGQSIDQAQLLAAVGAAPGKVVVLLDTCCAAGAIPKRPQEAPGAAFITACRRDESSFGQYERKDRPHGYFVIAVCEGLKGLADQDQDGVVTVGELENYVTNRATALCGEQHAVSRTPADLAGIALAQVEKERKADTLYDFAGARNPFGLPDIDRPLAEDVRTFAQETRVPGAADDENAQAWNERGLQGQAETIEGDWEYRWKGGNAGDAWVNGVAEIKIANERVFILCREPTARYMIEGRRGTNERIVGRYENLNDPDDTSPFVARAISAERIDGYWSDGRWDFRRVVAEK